MIYVYPRQLSMKQLLNHNKQVLGGDCGTSELSGRSVLFSGNQTVSAV